MGISRREVLAGLGATVAAGLPVAAPAQAQITRAIPGTREQLPVIGMGSWITFNVGGNEDLRRERLAVLQAFFDRGGALVDSSPMYGSSEEVIGYCLERIANDGALFSATKVWTYTGWLGSRQMDNSESLWGTDGFDLMQIHNLLDWEAHLETLLARKEAGRIRHIGITTSHGRDHAEFERIMTGQPIDFVQFTYNIVDREAERRLLPLAAERGLGVIINRPFRRGYLVDRVQKHPLPGWASEIGCENWPQLLLKFIVSHPAVTCAIPATTRVDHMHENMGAAHGPLPDEAFRKRMITHVENL